MDLLSLADRSWPVLSRLVDGHAVIYKASRGWIGHRVPGLPPMLLLEHVGAKSGAHRTSPLVYVADGRDVVLVASKGGYERHPAWYHNLRAHPEVTVQIGTERRPVRARKAEADERERLWPMAVRTWPGYGDYQQRTERQIPLMILEPRTP
jgi:deazaflavin-dependent oxidoreductase (nitroreductase family)